MEKTALQGPAISGVQVKTLTVNRDDRGFLMEILRKDDALFDSFGQAYVTSVKHGIAKAWHYHINQTDIFVCLSGTALVALADLREDSPTRGAAAEFVLEAPKPEGGEVLLLRIPPLVLHGFTAREPESALILNLPNRMYDYNIPDEHRLPWDSPEVPYRWPTFVTGGG